MKFLNRFLTGLALVALSAAASAGALTNYAENKILDATIRAQAIGAPATWYIGLDTVACDEAGGGTEVATGNYARVAVTASLANFAGTQSAGSTAASSGTNGTTSNNNAITWTTPNYTVTVVSMRWWDASTSGNPWICTNLTSSKTINSGDTVSFPAAGLSFQIDN